MPYLSLFKYGAPFLAGVALALLWHGFVMRGLQVEQLETERQQTAEIARITDENRQKIADADAKYTAELADAQSETASLAADLAAGTKRLRIKATCPVMSADSGAGIGNAGTAELSADARQAYLQLRGLLEQKEYQIKVLQGALR